MGTYTIEGGSAGKARLDVLSDVMAEATTSLLLRTGIRPGDHCVDVGCGGGNVSRQLAGLVRESGNVLGMDLDAEVIALARQEAQAAHLHNVSFVVGEATSIPSGPYEVAYARFLLSHVGKAATAVLDAMVSSLVPGGVVIVEDTDCSASFCDPASAAYRRYVELYCATVRRRGGEPDIGPTLPGLLRAVGLQDVEFRVTQPAGSTGPVKRMGLLTLERIAGSVLDEGLATRHELDQVLAELRRYTADPTTLMSIPAVVQAWGRKPHSQGGQLT